MLIALLFSLVRVLLNVQFGNLPKLALRFWSAMKAHKVDHSSAASDRIHLSEGRIAVKVEAS